MVPVMGTVNVSNNNLPNYCLSSLLDGRREDVRSLFVDDYRGTLPIILVGFAYVDVMVSHASTHRLRFSRGFLGTQGSVALGHMHPYLRFS